MATPEPPMKKKKQPSFAEDELLIMLNEANARKSIILPTNEAVTQRSKQTAWCEITAAVNSVSRVQRTEQDVRKKFRDYRSDIKKKIAKHRREGGGPMIDMMLKASEEAMLNLGLLEEDVIEGIPGVPESEDQVPFFPHIPQLPLFSNAQPHQQQQQQPDSAASTSTTQNPAWMLDVKREVEDINCEVTFHEYGNKASEENGRHDTGCTLSDEDSYSINKSYQQEAEPSNQPSSNRPASCTSSRLEGNEHLIDLTTDIRSDVRRIADSFEDAAESLRSIAASLQVLAANRHNNTHNEQ